jgi:tetratricopeptide (TPR) repeat protein
MTKGPNNKKGSDISADKWSIYSFKLQALVLFFIGFVFYFNSLNNQYALDDGIIIVKNDYVKKGFKGIKKILTTDAYDSYYRSMNAKQQLSGGRYRPLSIVTFAIEQQLFGEDYKENEMPGENVTYIRHFGNVFLYVLSVILLLYFLRKVVFPNNPILPFVVSLLFLIHPLHTEVVANAKSRDEILSFLFIISTFILFFKYLESKQTKHLLISLGLFFLAFLSKEYAITILLLLPMLLYIKGETIKTAITKTLPFLGVTLLYLIIRIKIVGLGNTQDNTDVLNNPYLFATSTEKWATQISILIHYLKQLFYPVVLSSDYSYNTFPYVNFSNPSVWLSIALHVSLIVATIWLFFKRHILSFALAFYLLHLLLVSNFIFNIGATMGERLVYHSSLGWAIFIGFCGAWVFQKLQSEELKKTLFFILLLPITIWCGAKTIERNADWENDNTLFTTDVYKVPNSALVNGNAGKALVDMSEYPENKAIEKELLDSALVHLKRSIEIHPKYVNGYINIGVVYFKFKEYDKTEEYWLKAKEIFYKNPLIIRNFEVLATVYYNDAMKIGISNPDKSIALLQKCTQFAPTNADYWYNLGGAYFTVNRLQEAIDAWNKTLMLKPDYEQAKQGMAAASAKLKM